MLALRRFTPARFAPVRSQLIRTAPSRFASLRFASRRSTNEQSVLRSLVSLIESSGKRASRRSTPDSVSPSSAFTRAIFWRSSSRLYCAYSAKLESPGAGPLALALLDRGLGLRLGLVE